MHGLKRWTGRLGTLAALTAAGALALSGVAAADNLVNDVVASTDSVAITTGGSVAVSYWIDNNSAGGSSYRECDATTSSPATVTIGVPSGASADRTTLVFEGCNAPQVVTFTSARAQSYEIGASISDPFGNYNVGGAKFALVVTDPTTTSHAPTVLVEAPDAHGDEGEALTTSGSFTDLDGNGTLTITHTGGAGTVVDNGDGTFDWSHTSPDDGSGSVTVQASDGEHPPVTQTFTWDAANVAPAVTATVERAGACTVDLDASLVDPGSADTHTTVVDWGDGTLSAALQGSHTYSSAGTYTIDVTVTDDDGGVGTDSSGFATLNTPSAIQQPINATGTRSVFKLGSTIPVKITVTDCDGQAVSTLAPAVSLVKLDSNPDGTITETAVTATPTNGTTMRWSDTQYIYNLSSKNSQFASLSGALTAGTYKVTVADQSFYGGLVTATFDLKK